MGAPIKTRALNFLVCADQLVFCVITLGASYLDETMSSVAWRMERDGRFWGFMRPVIDRLFWFQPNHRQCAYEAELLRQQYAKEFQTKTTTWI